MLLRIRLTPRADRDRVEGLREAGEDAFIAARVRAAPEKGAANYALERLIGDWLDIPVSRIAVVSGDTQRLKTVAVSGDAAALAALLEKRLAD